MLQSSIDICSTVSCVHWGGDFSLLIKNFLVLINERNYLCPRLVHTVSNDMCECAGGRKVRLLCWVMSAVSVPSKNSLEMLNDFRYSDVL